jgi:hypothetical protein
MRRFTPYLSIVMIAVFAGASLGCPMCRDSIADTATASYGDGTQAGLPAGFNFSIYYMLGGVFCMMALVIGVIAKGVRSADHQAAGVRVEAANRLRQ